MSNETTATGQGQRPEPPRVPATAELRPYDGRGRMYWRLRITCPFCGRRHTHGGGSGDAPSGGHRWPHCARRTADNAAGYVLDPCVTQGGRRP